METPLWAVFACGSSNSNFFNVILRNGLLQMLTSSPPQAARILAELDFWSSLFGGFLPQPPYFSGGQQEALVLGYPPIGLVDRRNIEPSEEKRKKALYPRPERRGFTAQIA